MNMTGSFKYIVLFFMLVSLACDDNLVIANCNDCTEEEPDYANVLINLDTRIPTVVLTVYEGNLEENIVYGTYYPQSPTFDVDLRLNRKYTFTARYSPGNDKEIITVDSAFPRVRYITDQCETPCYSVYNRKVNLRLKGRPGF